MITDVDDHGGVFRCLLRVRENAGNDVMSDREFLRRFAELGPTRTDITGWSLEPMRAAASALELAFDFQTSANYEEVLSDHRACRPVLVRVDAVRLGLHSRGEHDYRVTLLADMDEREMSLWCPLRSGSWDRLPPISRNRWEELQSLGVTLFSLAPTAA